MKPKYMKLGEAIAKKRPIKKFKYTGKILNVLSNCWGESRNGAEISAIIAIPITSPKENNICKKTLWKSSRYPLGTIKLVEKSLSASMWIGNKEK
jgi:hypothetical protein